MSAPCRFCDEPITWGITEAGNRMPLNLGPDPAGNVVMVAGTMGGTPRIRVLTKAEQNGNLLESQSAEPRYMPHKATCTPKAGRRIPPRRR